MVLTPIKCSNVKLVSDTGKTFAREEPMTPKKGTKMDRKRTKEVGVARKNPLARSLRTAVLRAK